jgi:single-strand DNA-binding protein
MIKLQVIGNLGKDCVVNNVNGKTVMNFTVAHSEKYRDAQGNQKDRAVWVDCAYWTDRTAVAAYLKKGKTVFVEGTPDVRTYTTQDGRNGASLTLRVTYLQLVGGQGGGDNNDGGGSGYSRQSSGGGYDNSQQSVSAADLTAPIDDLPF